MDMGNGYTVRQYNILKVSSGKTRANPPRCWNILAERKWKRAVLIPLPLGIPTVFHSKTDKKDNKGGVHIFHIFQRCQEHQNPVVG